MTKAEMQDYIQKIISGGAENGLEIFVYLKDDNEYTLKKLRVTDKLKNSVNSRLIDSLKQKYLPEDIEYDSSDNIADNKKSLYEVLQDEQYHPFKILKEYQLVSEVFTESDKASLIGFFFRLNLNDNFFWIYQHVYSLTRIDRSKHIYAIFAKNTYDEIDNDILKIDSRIDILIINDTIITSKIDLLQRCFSFERYIREGAQKTIHIIEDLNIVKGLDIFVALEGKRKLTNSKKLLKAKNSVVLKLDKNTLLMRLKAHSRYSNMFTFEDDYIVIKTQKEAESFIKMLNDDIVRSELTGQEYDSPSKSILAPKE